ncbi:hypothetical protein PX701_01110 [Agromyces sp. H3Y2-19a]|uniref:hypothetical protein n=1 Tax=Agromyces TaxID=33877 RepID=UPI001E384764|nr:MULTISPECIES: hypothetical protein [Agromyces]MCD5345843.1 hypothetical protein [Agromyces sp. S2-1-8]MDF0512208.1 hypothetical protein [Agromyces chromiiresistens]
MNRATQLARGAATASVALFLAAFSHGVAGGEAPGSVGLALAAIVALGASVAFVGRRTTPVRTALAVIASQAAFHLLFGVGSGPASGEFVTTGGGHHATMAFVESAGAASTAAHDGHGAAMLIGHALAAVATIVYLLVLERTAWSALATATRRFALVFAGRAGEPVAIIAPPTPRLATLVPPALRSRLRFAALRYRGPPLLPAFA